MPYRGRHEAPPPPSSHALLASLALIAATPAFYADWMAEQTPLLAYAAYGVAVVALGVLGLLRLRRHRGRAAADAASRALPSQHAADATTAHPRAHTASRFDPNRDSTGIADDTAHRTAAHARHSGPRSTAHAPTLRERRRHWQHWALDSPWPPWVLSLAMAVGAASPAGAAHAHWFAWRAVSALALLLLTALQLRPLMHRGSVPHMLVLALLVLLACGVGFWWLEPNTPTLADGIWLAFTTAATVGYGDIVPSTSASRMFAVFVVMLGLGVLTLTTAAIATSWIESEENRVEAEILRDVHQQIGQLRHELSGLRAELHALRAEAQSAAAKPAAPAAAQPPHAASGRAGPDAG